MATLVKKFGQAAGRLVSKVVSGLVMLTLALALPAVAFAEDTTVPSDVEGLAGFPGDSQVTLTWDPATDDTGVSGYNLYSGLSSVTEEGGSYTFGSTDVGDVTTYVMENLSNGVTYYFAMTAYDDEGNESEFYSEEVDATPEAAETGDFLAPTVSGASAMTSTLVEVEFSEEVTLPEDSASAFSIEATDGTQLEVLDAYVSDDASIVFIVTDVQTAGAQYILTAGIGISDSADNPIVSGTSDTGVFTGSSLEKVEEEEEVAEEEEAGEEEVAEGEEVVSEGFVLDEVEAAEVNELELSFTEAVSVAEGDAFTIQALEDASVTVEVLAVSIDEEDATLVTLVTEDMEPGLDYVLALDETVLNEAGESLAEDGRSVEFTAKTLELADLIAPEDVTNLLGRFVRGEPGSVLLEWTKSVDSAGDLAKYLVYASLDGGLSFGEAIEVASDHDKYKLVGLTPGATYTFKVTAVDENGNESEGMLTTVKLPETGPELLGLGLLSLLGAGAWGRKKR